jgi:hypothetical protein
MHVRNLVVAAFGLVVLGLAPLAAGADQTGLAQVEDAIKVHVDSGPLGEVTQEVRCGPVGAAEAHCTLTSVAGTELHARVVRDGDDLQLMWEPLEG